LVKNPCKISGKIIDQGDCSGGDSSSGALEALKQCRKRSLTEFGLTICRPNWRNFFVWDSSVWVRCNQVTMNWGINFRKAQAKVKNSATYVGSGPANIPFHVNLPLPVSSPRLLRDAMSNRTKQFPCPVLVYQKIIQVPHVCKL